MTMKCDRCGNTFVWYDNTMTIGASETSEQWKGCGNAVQKAVIDHSYVPLDWYKQSDMEPIALSPSCMAKLDLRSRKQLNSVRQVHSGIQTSSV